MKILFIKIAFLCLIILSSNCNTDFNELDIISIPNHCQTTPIELDLRSRMHRSELNNYSWRDWTDGLNIHWTNGGRTMIFSFPPNFICKNIAIMGAETQDICPMIHSDFNAKNQSFTLHLSQCLIEQPSIFLSISHH